MFGRLISGSGKEKQPKATSQRRGHSPSVIAAGMHVLGNIVSEGTLDIDGQIEGNVRAETISIRENGLIHGDVIADTVYVYGVVRGLIKARTVLLYAEAKVTGTIMHESITIEDGANVDGKFKRMERVLDEEDAIPQRLLSAPTVDNEFHNDNDEPATEAEIKILENLRLIS